MCNFAHLSRSNFGSVMLHRLAHSCWCKYGCQDSGISTINREGVVFSCVRVMGLELFATYLLKSCHPLLPPTTVFPFCSWSVFYLLLFHSIILTFKPLINLSSLSAWLCLLGRNWFSCLDHPCFFLNFNCSLLTLEGGFFKMTFFSLSFVGLGYGGKDFLYTSWTSTDSKEYWETDSSC